MNLYLYPLVANALYISILVAAVYWLDLSEKEPLGFYLKVYGWSILGTCIYSVTVARALGLLNLNDFTGPVLAGPLLEESLKIGIFFLVVWNSPHFDERVDAIIYAMVIALGFAVTENIEYTVRFSSGAIDFGVSEYFRQFNQILLARAAPGHMSFDAIAGVFLGRAKFSSHPKRWIWIAFFTAVLLHMGWNLLASLSSLVFYGYFVLLLALAIGLTIKTARASRFRTAWEDLSSHLKQAAAVLDHNTQRFYIQRYNRIARHLPNLARVTGEEQTAMRKRLEQVLEIVGKSDREYDDLVGEELGEIEREIKGYGSRADWQFLAMLFLGLLFVSVAMLLVSFLLQWIWG